MISGFTLVRNGLSFDYPFRESILSLLPIVDELVVNVGDANDGTFEALQAMASTEPKLKIFQSRWPLDDPEKRHGGRILAEQTNLALEKCQGDWCIYLQADEVLHEDDYARLKAAMKSAPTEVEGLLFDYIHFYGSFDIIQESRSAYRREVRAFRRKSGAMSVGDAQSFRRRDGTKLEVIRSGARVFHYGWVRPPEKMKEKTRFMDALYHGAEGCEATGDNYRYKRIWGLHRFEDTHPAVMRERIAAKNWKWDIENSPLEWKASDAKKVALDLFERATGVRLFEYRSYKLRKGRNP